MVANITLTTFGIGAYGLQSGKIHWMALGYQQWGVIRNSSYSTSWVQSITFPIRFKLAYIAIANAYDVDRTGDHKAEFGCHAFNLTTSGLSYCYHGSAGGDCSDTATYIAIGQAQQWGTATQNGYATSFPLTFPVRCLAVVATYVLRDDSSYWQKPLSLQAITRSSFTAATASGWGANDTALWIAVGMQCSGELLIHMMQQ